MPQSSNSTSSLAIKAVKLGGKIAKATTGNPLSLISLFSDEDFRKMIIFIGAIFLMLFITIFSVLSSFINLPEEVVDLGQISAVPDQSSSILGTFNNEFEKAAGLDQIATVLNQSSPISPASLQCNQTRHKAEEVICWLQNGVKENPTFCPISFYKVCIDPQQQVSGCVKDFAIVRDCLNYSNFSAFEKAAIINSFKESIAGTPVLKTDVYAGKLQSEGFVKAIENSLNRNIGNPNARCKARDFLLKEDCRPDYKVVNADEIKDGDLAIGTTDGYDHMGIIIKKEGNVKIFVAQAWGRDGSIFISEETIDNYQGFLQYKY